MNLPSSTADSTARRRGNCYAPPDTKMLKKKHRQLSGYESANADELSPESGVEDEEVDETFLALQKLLKALNSTRPASAQVVPATTATTTTDSMGGSGRGGVPTRRVLSTSNSNYSNQQQRPSQEELLESRRRERERFRHMLFSKSRSTRRRPAYYRSEEEDEEDEPVLSVESQISNRVISGSFTQLNVHVISRDRWAREEVERLPVVLLPKNGKIVSPEDNPKLKVCRTKEYVVLQNQLMESLSEMPEMMDHSRLLTPPQSTWYIQMRGIDGIQC